MVVAVGVVAAAAMLVVESLGALKSSYIMALHSLVVEILGGGA